MATHDLQLTISTNGGELRGYTHAIDLTAPPAFGDLVPDTGAGKHLTRATVDIGNDLVIIGFTPRARHGDIRVLIPAFSSTPLQPDWDDINLDYRLTVPGFGAWADANQITTLFQLEGDHFPSAGDPRGTLMDARFDSLRERGFTGHINDMLLAWLQQESGIAPPASVYVNPELAGGADSGPGNVNPPTGHTLGFVTCTGLPIPDGNRFIWRFNDEATTGRCYLNYDLATNHPGLNVGDELTVSYLVRQSGLNESPYTAALAAGGVSGITILEQQRTSQHGVWTRVFYRLRIDDPSYSIGVRAGTGTTSNSEYTIEVQAPELHIKPVGQATYPKTLPDAWREMLASKGFTGHRVDAWFAYLGSLGFSGSLNDRELQFWSGGGGVVDYDFDGTQQYAVMPAYQALGDPTAYRTSITFTTNNPDGNIVNPQQPIAEFSRVFDGQDTNYHLGSLRNLRISDSSPINSRNYYQCSGTSARVTVPLVYMREGSIQFDFIFNDTRDQWLLGDDAAAILEVDTLKLVGGPGVTLIELDGREYDNRDLVQDQHYRVRVEVSEQNFTRLMGHCGVANLIVTNR